MITTTLNRIREHSPCEDGWTNLLAGLGKTSADDDVLPFATILEINGLDDAHWCCRAEPQHAKEWRLLMVAYARRVEHLIIVPKAKNAIDVAERYANGMASDEELSDASIFAWDAVAKVTPSRKSAAMAAIMTVEKDIVKGVTRDALRDSAWYAAKAAEWKGGAAAVGAERKWQEQEFLRVVTETGASDGCC